MSSSMKPIETFLEIPGLLIRRALSVDASITPCLFFLFGKISGELGRPVSLYPGSSEQKECYYHISDVPLCDSVLANNTTKEECCCTEGAAWGDNCETHPCPVIGSGKTFSLQSSDFFSSRHRQEEEVSLLVLFQWCAVIICFCFFLTLFLFFLFPSSMLPVEYIDICPSGKGYIPVEGMLIFGQTSYTGILFFLSTIAPKYLSAKLNVLWKMHDQISHPLFLQLQAAAGGERQSGWALGQGY